jgi:hypothetical protein
VCHFGGRGFEVDFGSQCTQNLVDMAPLWAALKVLFKAADSDADKLALLCRVVYHEVCDLWDSRNVCRMTVIAMPPDQTSSSQNGIPGAKIASKDQTVSLPESGAVDAKRIHRLVAPSVRK